MTHPVQDQHSPEDTTRINLPKYTYISDAESRMTKVQFMNRNTYGTMGPVDRQPRDHLTSLHTTRRPTFGLPTVKAASWTVDPSQAHQGRAGAREPRLSGTQRHLTGFNTVTGEPYSIVGHIHFNVFTPPTAAVNPWALEAPYPSRYTIQDTLSAYKAHQRPFCAFPAHTTHLRPILDYLQPPAAHPAGVNALIQPARNLRSNQIILVSTIASHQWKPTRGKSGVPFRIVLLRIPSGSPPPRTAGTSSALTTTSPRIGLDWEYMGDGEDGWSRWRELLPSRSLPRATPVDFPPDPIAFEGGLPDIPNDTSDLGDDPTRYELICTIHQKLTSLRLSSQPTTTPPDLPSITIVQIPDPGDRYSRPVPRYVVLDRHQEEFEQLGRVTVDLARQIRQTQRARRSQPWRNRAPRRITSPPDVWEADSDHGDDVFPESSPTHYNYSDEEELCDPEDEYSADASEEEKEMGLLPPVRPLETDTSYFPMILRHDTSISTDSSMPGLENVSRSRVSSISSHAGSGSSLSSDDIILYDAGLQYPRSADPTPIANSPAPTMRTLSQSPLPASPMALVNLPGTTPLPVRVPLVPLPETVTRHAAFGQFAQAALSSAERALRGFTLSLRPDDTTSILMRELTERVRDLEQAVLSAHLLSYETLPPVCPSVRSWRPKWRPLISSRISSLRTSETLKFITQKLHPGIDELLLHFSQTALVHDEKADLSPPFDFPPAETPRGVRVSLEDEEVVLKDEEMQAAETCSPMQRPPSRRGHHLEPSPEAFALNLPDTGVFDLELDEDNTDRTTLSIPPTEHLRRADPRNECGAITYNRRQYGWHDYMNGTPPWRQGDRERSEAIGYALEFSDRYVLFARSQIGKLLFSNLQMKRFRHTDRRMREESAHQARTAQNPEEELAPTNTLMLVATASFRAKETSTPWSSFWMIW
ncbi:hypothetical protein B0H17DRAFT_1302707 [Mycena rosella]|uniref:Uncharacterized protein n=1 Tax=Mycena rosella TaxID=1033263 RepID=A0AAD7B831_MYCRO|nr:hypothetical protein B0H17DRAFT_1302707 [Mycena rosella]